MRLSVLVALLGAPVLAALVEKHSMGAPFLHLNDAGERTLQNYSVWLDATVYKNFVRLTQDRHSRRGFIAATTPLGLPEFSMVTEFRASGKGRDLYGDGLGIWLTQYREFEHGGVYGYPEEFTGFGVIIDTFKNLDSHDKHYDVSVVWNDGTRGEDAIVASRVGCDVPNLRYYEKHVDFSTFNTSRVRISVEHGFLLTVEVDAAADGHWKSCAVLRDHKVPESLIPKLYLSMHASTGLLTDNHDIVSVHVYDVPSEGTELHSGPARQPAHHDPVDDLEHRIEGTVDRLRSVYAQLKAAEGLDENRINLLEFKVSATTDNALMKRIEEIEEGVQKMATSKLTDRIAALAPKVAQTIDDSLMIRVKELEAKVDKLVGERLKGVSRKLEESVHSHVAASGATSWKIPVGIFAALLLGFYMWTFQWTRKLHAD